MTWEVAPLWSCAANLDRVRVPLNSEERSRCQGDVPYWGANGVVDHVDRALVGGDVVLVGEDGAPFFEPTKPVAFSVTEPIWPNNHVHVLRPRPHVDGRWLTHALNTTDYSLHITGSTRDKLTRTALDGIRVPLPPLELQQRIADYLDTETARIDTLITKNEHAATLLEERHYAYLEHSIWRPEFPRRKLSGVCDPSRPIRYGIVLPGPSVDDGVPLIKGGDVHRQTLEGGTDARVDREVEAGHVRSRVSPGDLVYTIRGSYGDVAVVPDNLPVANLTQDVARIAPRHVETDWLRFALDAPSARSYADVIATGATIRGVNIGDLRHMPVPVPESNERDRILRETRRVLGFLAQTEERLSKQRELLLERRQALITAAVTGEFEV